ncbi:Uncharacterised protein [Mycobacteroides abscessus subsp. abscessus]|nr:Uncharacterised protein [Mycobacteroides abscessus subsp. abscessus]
MRVCRPRCMPMPMRSPIAALRYPNTTTPATAASMPSAHSQARPRSSPNSASSTGTSSR